MKSLLEAISPTAAALLAEHDKRKAPMPVLALSVRQPWAWLIVNGWKNVENRTKPTRQRGPVLIHASLKKTADEYEACQIFIASFGWKLELPPIADLPTGGIVGRVTILDCVNHAGNANHAPICGGGHAARSAQWQDVIIEPDCRRCQQILKRRSQPKPLKGNLCNPS